MRTSVLLTLAGILISCKPKGWDAESSTDTAALSDEDGGGDTGTVIEDLDGDGYTADTDCDDEDPGVHPDSAELCDGVDNNCDGSIDGADATDATEWYADADADGFGDPAAPQTACDPPSGTVADATDCDDTLDSTFPGAPERCNTVDDDCDGAVDEDVTSIWYFDADGDGHGDASQMSESCDPDPGFVTESDDCDDAEADAFPGNTEVCDEIDNNCDGDIDEGVTSSWFSDADGDGFGDAGAVVSGCTQPANSSTVDGDCDDSDGTISPYATELCDGVDNNCDGVVDEATAADASAWYADADADGYGDGSSATTACDAPSGYVSWGSDCDDSDPAVSPAATEICNGVDDNCDGWTDDDDPAITGTSTWYLDYDADGYGTSALSVDTCVAPASYVDNDDDCDDTEPLSNPGETEVCDSLDNDCDGVVDEDDASDASTWYTDADADTYGDAATASVSCEPASGEVADDTDCDDSEATVYPGAPELYDGLDNDCDGDADEELWVGTGADGDLDVTVDTDLSADASGGRSAPDAVAYAVTAISGATITVGETVAGLAAGDELLIINLQGSDTNNASVGAYEFASVSAVSGDEITLSDAVAELYGETDNADLTDQVITVQRVPHYGDVNVYAGATLSTAGWDGVGGGALAFRATGSVWVEDGGAIDVSALGYAGGETGTCNNCDAFQGESIAGEGVGDVYAAAYNESIGGYLANYGGGGANVTGAGGEYGGGATDADSWNPGVYSAPEAGEEYGDDALESLHLGSGGGGVWNGGSDDVGEDPGPGGDGAGILYIGAGLVQIDGTDGLTATGGSTDHWADGSWTYGAGGGSGGSVWIIAEEVDLATDSVDASGGWGESTHTRLGGDGGDGRVRVDCNTCGGAAWGTAAANTALDDACAPDPGHSATPE